MTARAALVVVVALAAMASLAGCGRHAEATAQRAPLTEAQRDSVIARSDLPGAGVVGAAMRVSGREARRADGLDSLAR